MYETSTILTHASLPHFYTRIHISNACLGMFPKVGDGIIHCIPSKIRTLHLYLIIFTMYLTLLHFILFMYSLGLCIHSTSPLPTSLFFINCYLWPSHYIILSLVCPPNFSPHLLNLLNSALTYLPPVDWGYTRGKVATKSQIHHQV